MPPRARAERFAFGMRSSSKVRVRFVFIASTQGSISLNGRDPAAVVSAVKARNL